MPRLLLTLVLVLVCTPVRPDTPTAIATNRTLEVLDGPVEPARLRAMFRQAGKLLDAWRIYFTYVEIDGVTLRGVAGERPQEPFVRVVREELCRPIDVEDFVYFLDDLLLAGQRGLRGELVWILPGRARGAGLLVHPDDVFRKDRPRLYGAKGRKLAIDKPQPQPQIIPAEDGDPLGPGWVARYKNPIGEENMMRALSQQATSETFPARVASLLGQLRAQGAECTLWSTVRHRERGYLMYGSFILSRAGNRRQVRRRVRMLDRLNVAWKLGIPIRWRHPDGWRATIEAARKMRDAYPVVYATRSGAKRSRHYDGEAVDFTAVSLPRRLVLQAPGGARRTFDLSAPSEPRDVNLTPRLIRWIEKHFGLGKLLFDYPHWNDRG